MKKFFSLVIPFAFVASSAAALEVTNTVAGNLSTSLQSSAETVTTLKVNGTVNAADLKFIVDKCPALNSLDLSSATIEAYSGAEINGLTQYPAATIPAMMFAGSTIKSISFPSQNPLSIGEAAFLGSSIEQIVIGDNISDIGMGAFAACPALRSATIHQTALSESTFMNCKQLQSVALNGLTTISKSTFADCDNLSTISGSETVERIGENSFMGCSSLSTFNFGADLVTIGNDAFALSGLTEVDLSRCENLKSIGDWAFARMPDLTTVIINDNVRSVGKGAFFEDVELTGFNHPVNSTTISSYALTGNVKIDTAKIINDGLTTIQPYALANLSHVETLKIPASVEYIGDHAMQNMTSLNTLTVNEHSVPPTLGEDVWDGVYQPGVKLIVGQKYVDEFKVADQWQDFNIVGSTNVEDVIANDVATANVQGRFLGTLLQIQSTGAVDIAHVSVYDISGALLIDSPVASDFVQIETEANQGKIFIVRVQLANGTSAALKLARK